MEALVNLKLTLALGLVISMAVGSLAQNPPSDDGKAKERELVSRLNEKLSQAKAAREAGDLDRSIAILNEAISIDPSRDLIWFRLGEDYRLSKRYQEAIAAYKRAIAIKPVGPYYNNLGEAESKLGDLRSAEQAYRTAAQVDPSRAAQYYFNIGAIETNAGVLDAANAAFDDAIHADPTFANAYYFKATNLLSDSRITEGTAVFPPEASTDSQKYLELAPSGPYASKCRQVLELIGRHIVTTYTQRNGTNPTSDNWEEPATEYVPPIKQEQYILRKVMPIYPELARAARVEGIVVLAAVISPDGDVFHLETLSGNPFLVESAIDAVRQWKYKKFTVKLQPVFLQTEITVNFWLESEKQSDSSQRELQLRDLLQLLRDHVSLAEVADVIRANKVSFDMTEAMERKIREAGGDDAVIQAAQDSRE